MGYGLGIDVGTTYTAAAVFRNGQLHSVTLGQNSDAMPTTVYLTETGDFVVGDVARRRMTEDPAGGAREFKRRLGDSTPLVLNGSPYSADRLMAVVIRRVIRAVTEVEGAAPAHIVVTHPSNWQAFKVDLIRQAAVSVADGVPVSLVEEPVAAAIHYAHAERIQVRELVGVYDLGGGTFDAAVLQRTDTGFRRLGEPTGIERLGGIDFDAALMAHVQRSLGERFTALDTKDPAVRVGLEELRIECIEAKQALSVDTAATIHVGVPGLHDSVRITRGEFEQLIRPVLRETIDSLRAAIRQAGATADQLAAVLLIGGSSRIPLVSEIVSAEIGRPVAVDAHPKLAVAMGAAVASQRALEQAAAAAVAPVAPAPAETTPDPASPAHDVATTTSPAREARARNAVSARALIPVAAVVGALALAGIGWFAFARDEEPAAAKKPKVERQFIEIDDITVEAGRYRVEYLVTGFVPEMSDDPKSKHIHFFLDTTEPENAGANGQPPGEWDQTDNPSSKLTDFTPGNRGDAERMCAVVVDHNHEVLDPTSGNCAALPAAPVPQRPTERRTFRPRTTDTPTPTHTPTPTATATAPTTSPPTP